MYKSLAATAILLTGTCLAVSAQPASHQWPSFRGENARGYVNGTSTPTTWDVATGEKVKWKIDLPGLSHASPIVWDDRVYVCTAVGENTDPELRIGLYGDIDAVDERAEHRWIVYAIDKHDGHIVWQQTAHTGVPKVKRHTKASHANSTPATDGKHLVALLGSEGLYCYAMDGALLWKVDLGVLDSGYFRAPEAQWGFASSPIIHDGKVIVQCDIQKGSFLAAFDVETGKELWRTPREDVPTWSTPTIYTVDGNTRIAVNGWRHMGGYDFATGKEIWKIDGGGDIPVPTPVFAEGLLFINNAHGRMSPIYAIQPNAEGDISPRDNAPQPEAMAWGISRGGAYMQTPLVYGGYLYNLRGNGVLSCFEAKSGKLIYEEKLGTPGMGFTASAVAAEDKIYCPSEPGTIFVVAAGPEFKVLSENAMGDVCMATPAISDGVIFFRTQHGLVAIGE